MAQRFVPNKNALGQINRIVLSSRNQRVAQKAAGQLAQNTMNDMSPVMFAKGLQLADLGAERTATLMGSVISTFPEPKMLPQVLVMHAMNDAIRLPMELARIFLEGMPNPKKFAPERIS